MEITINDYRKIYAIREEFNAIYPFLKIDFYSRPKKKGDAPPKKIVKHSGKTLGECRTVNNPSEIIINKDMTVSELEQCFKDVYGLGIKISRKSGNVWLETSMTQNWTLEEQEKEGESLSKKLGK